MNGVTATAVADGIQGTPAVFVDGTRLSPAELASGACVPQRRARRRRLTVAGGMLHAMIPSPSDGVWYLGPIPLRAYALCIIAGIFIAIWVGQKRWVDRGGDRALIGDVAIWAVPFGIVGGRLYHVISSPDAYFGEGGEPLKAFAVWEGGLGIWGRSRSAASAHGSPAVAPAYRSHRSPTRWPRPSRSRRRPVVGATGSTRSCSAGPTTLPWGLRIDPDFRPPGFQDIATYHATFLYESLWNIGVALLVVWADRRFRLGHGRAFALYVAAYTVGRGWIEYLRIDPAEDVFGLRLNVWVSIVVFLAAVAYIVVVGSPPSRPRGAGRPSADLPDRADARTSRTRTTRPTTPRTSGTSKMRLCRRQSRTSPEPCASTRRDRRPSDGSLPLTGRTVESRSRTLLACGGRRSYARSGPRRPSPR